MGSFTYNYTVLATELDSFYQHLHHASSLKYLERGRLDMLTDIGFPNEDFIKNGLFLVITKIEAHYLREVREGEIQVTCSDLRIKHKTVMLHQTLINERGKLAIEAEVYSQFLSGETKRGTTPPEQFIAKFK